MEEMKNLIIQSLETKGVLGQIRANLRSAVFKMVNEQDQQFKLGCGLKWENPTLYKIIETKIGTLLSEVIRDFMEYFRMDYSLSIFIPECGISPERLKKEEIFGKMGFQGSNESLLSQMQLPFLYYVMFYFIESIKENPEHVVEILKKVTDNVEVKSDEILDANITENYKNHKPEEDDIPISGDRNISNNVDQVSNKSEKNPTPPKEEQEEFEEINEESNSNKKRVHEYEDNSAQRRGRLSLDDYVSNKEQEKKKEEKPKEKSIDEIPVEELDIEEIKEDIKEEHKIGENIISSTGEVPEEIEEKIEDSYDQSGNKKSNILIMYRLSV